MADGVTMELTIKILIVWCILSIPFALFMGKFIRAGNGKRD
jgi:hypothetical protein